MDSRRSLFLLFVICALLCYGLPACGGDKPAECNPKCYLETTTRSINHGMEVTYEAKATGDGSFSTIAYIGNTAEQYRRPKSDEAPLVSWKDTMWIEGPWNIGIRAWGSVRNGKLTIQYKGLDDISEEAHCEHACSRN